MVAEVVGIPLVGVLEFFSVFFRVSGSCSGSVADGVVVEGSEEGDFRFLEAVLADCFCSALRSLSSLPIAGRAMVVVEVEVEVEVEVFLPLLDAAEVGFFVVVDDAVEGLDALAIVKDWYGL